MIETVLAVSGTLAVGLAERAGSAILEARSDAYFCQLVGKVADRFKTNTQQENRELEKAFRWAGLKGTESICQRRRRMLGGRAAPTGVFGQEEKEWLDKAEAYLGAKIRELEQGKDWLPARPNEEYRALVVPKGNVSSAERIEEFRRMLITDAIAELTQAAAELRQEGGTPPDWFGNEMDSDWFGLACEKFQDAIARDPLLANKFQNQTLVEISSDTGEIKFTLAEVLELLRDTAGKGRPIEHSAVFNLPNLRVEVYDREAETAEVLRALCEGKDQFYLVVAPSGFGNRFWWRRCCKTSPTARRFSPTIESGCSA